jgi:hypothetical protein
MMRTAIAGHGARSGWLVQLTAAAVLLGLAAGVWVLLGRARTDQATPVPPEIVRSDPADGAINVASTGEIQVEFAARPDRVPTLRLEPADGRLYPGQWTGTTYSWRYEDLDSKVEYHAVVDQEYLSLEGKQRHVQHAWRFTTKPAVPASARSCRVSDMSLRWGQYGSGESPGAIAGSFTLANTSASPCTLKGPLQIQPRDSKGALSVTRTQLNQGTLEFPLALQPSQEAHITFVWINYCRAISGDLVFGITLPNVDGQLKTGPYRGDTPRCYDSGSASILSMSTLVTAP